MLYWNDWGATKTSTERVLRCSLPCKVRSSSNSSQVLQSIIRSNKYVNCNQFNPIFLIRQERLNMNTRLPADPPVRRSLSFRSRTNQVGRLKAKPIGWLRLGCRSRHLRFGFHFDQCLHLYPNLSGKLDYFYSGPESSRITDSDLTVQLTIGLTPVPDMAYLIS